MNKSIINSIRAVDSPPQPSPKKRSRTLLFAIILIIIIAVAAVGIYLATQSAGTTPSVTPTPTPIPGSTTTPSPTATSSVTGADIATASSLQYTVTVTDAGVSQGSYTYYGKNAGTANFMMRIEVTDADGAQSIFILNGAQRKAWSYSDGQWDDVSMAYDSQFSTWNALWQGYSNSLSGWSGIGDWSYTAGNSGIRISNVNVNPVLPDSLFQHS